MHNSGLSITTQPATLAVELDDMKQHLRVDIEDDDVLISALIRAAIQHVEMFTRRILIETEFELKMDWFPASRIFTLPRSPIISVVSINYLDEDGVSQLLATTEYDVDTSTSRPARIALAPDADWPRTESGRINTVDIQFKCGFRTAAKVGTIPDAFRAAIILLVGHWYENREAVSPNPMKELPLAVQSLLWGERIYEIADNG